MIELVQQFREFKPYLKKRLAYIQSTGREYELQDEIEDIRFYLELMNDILVDESHGVDQLKGYIDKIHEMIRKNPMTDVSGRRLSSLEEDEYSDNDRPRSPSPGARGLDSVTDDIPLIPTHGAHRTVDVIFSPENDRSSEPMEGWGKSRHSSSYFAPDSYNKDVDMRGNYCGTGRGQRRWSEENNFGGTGGSGRGSWGVGRGSGMPGMNDLDIRPGRGRGRGYSDIRIDRNRPDWYHSPAFEEMRKVKQEREPEREFKMPSWLEDNPAPPNNGNPFGDWQQNTDRSQEPTWMRNPSRNHNSNENREYEDGLSQKQFAQYFERRPSSETRRSDRSEEYLSDQRSRNERGFEPPLNRPELNRSPVDCPRGPVHGDFHGRVPNDDDRHVRSRVDAGSPYLQQGTPPGTNPMSSVGSTHQQGYGVPQQQPHYPNHGAGLLPSPPYGGSPPLLSHPPRAPGGMHMSNARQPIMPGTGRPMGYKPRTMNNTSFMRPPGGGYHIPPPSFTPTGPPHSATQKPQQSHPFHETSVPQKYASPMEPIDRVREISSMKAKQCFGRQLTRPPTSTPPGQPSPGASTSTSAALGQLSPNTTNNEPQSSAIDSDGRADRLGRMAGYCPVQSRQQSPPTAPKPRSNTTSGSEAGNVLRQSSSSDPRIRQRTDPERRKLDEVRDRVIYHESLQKQSHKPSKLAQIRKQLEKEGLHRLGRPHHKKQSGSFEDAIASCDTSLEQASGKSERIKSPTSSQSKERGVGAGRESRSHSEKTETRNSSKKSSRSHKSKEKQSGSKGVDVGSERKRSKDSTDRSSPKRSQRKMDDKEKSSDNSKPASSDFSSKSSKTTIQQQTGVEKRGDDVALSKFKIPRKPKPVEAQKPPATQKETTPPESPESPEPALTQVPDSDTRVEDNETPSTSAKSTATIKTTTPDKSEVNPNALEMLKQFLVTTSSDPSDVQSILQNPDALKNFFLKIKAEISAAKEKSGEEVNSNETATMPDADIEVEAVEKSQAPNEEVQERGRSREKKRNTKRRSSLEKLHDALKEMRFDTMLPLGPRRCTRGGQEDNSTEVGAESLETSDKLETTPAVTETPPVVENTEGFAKRQVSKKRGRPPKETKSKKRVVKKGQPQLTEAEESVQEEEVEAASSAPVAATARKGKKKKVKGTKVAKRKRGKKVGPVTRAQSALKKVVLKKFAKDVDEATTQENEEESQKTTGRILRRLTRRQVGKHDSAVNTNLCKVKLEAHKTVSLKEEHEDPDPFIDSTNNMDEFHLADQLANIINENLDTVANMDGQTEDSMDLDIFNTLDDAPDVDGFDVMNPLNSTSENNIDKPVDPSSTPSSSSNVTAETSVTTTTTTTEVEEESNPPVISTTPVAEVVAKQPETSPVENIPISASGTNPKTEANHQQEELDTSSEDVSFTTFSSENQENEITSQNTSSESSNPPDVSNIHPEAVASSVATDSVESNEPDTAKTETTDGSELRKDVFKCDKCNFSGKKIIPHYVNKHSSCNIPQARLMPTTFDGLIELNISESPQLLEIPLEGMFPTAWPCLYCENKYGCTVDFYEHLTSHTGEFRYVCGECGIAYPFQKSLMNHIKQHKGVSKNCVRHSYDLTFDKKSTELSGFLCNDCYYFQLRFENIILHIEETKHSSSDVKSIRFTRNSITSAPASVQDSGNNSTSPPPVTSMTSDEGEESSDKVPMPTLPEPVNSEQSFKEPDKMLMEASDKEPSVSSLHNQTPQPVDESEIQCVLFGTDSNFIPHPINLNECTLPIKPVFEASFLDSLLRRVSNSESDGTSSCDVTSRKRKRDKSADADETLDSSSYNGDATGENRSLEAAGDGDNSSQKPPPKRTCNIRTTYSTRQKWDKAVEDYIEPNNFFESGDELSDESDSTDSDDEIGKNGFDPFKIKTETTEDLTGKENILRNNEHIIKTRSLINDDNFDKMYKEKGNFMVIRRPGDLYAANTVIFGYIKPPTGKSTPKLRDEKEADKLGGIAGKRMFPMKEEKAYMRMMTKEKLIHLFKCMATHCSYTTDEPFEFLEHLSAKHFKIRQMQQSCSRLMTLCDVKLLKDSDACSYCSARLKDPKEVVEHVVNQHGRSIYQCSKCFFRAYYHRSVVRHIGMEHPSDNCSIIKCSKRAEIQYNEATLFQIFVYKCDLDNPSCDKGRRFVFREDFMEHITACVPPQDLYPCHLCKERVALGALIEHYKTHNLFKFHCSYCQFGSEVKTDLDEHFVNVHPNTSGRVFYRVKPSDTSQPGSLFHRTNNIRVIYPSKKRSPKSTPLSNTPSESMDTNSEKDSSDGHSNLDGSGLDNGDFDDNEKGRVTGLKGEDLYRCVTGECTFVCRTGDAFKEHVTTCSQVAESRSLSCAHCERKMKTPINLLEHLKGHGEKKLICSLCSFRCWTITEITKHLKTVHRVLYHKLIRKESRDEDTDPDVLAIPKEVASKSSCDLDTFANNYYSLARKAVYSFENIEKLPLSKIFSSELHCAMCPFATKVRSNMVRHLTIHKQALEDGKTVVPQAPRINPVPYLSREGLEFDKMMNLAASSHKTGGGSATADVVQKLPQFVKEQFRYVCSICEHITSDDALLQTHIKVIHSEVTSYKCPHCQTNPETKDNPDNTVPLDKISHHLRLHGPKLYKCGHCMVVHYQLRLMEKHIPERHPEKKPIHYLIRDVDPDGVPSARATTSGANRRQSVEDPNSASSEKWKCFLCSSKTIFGSWEETKSHCEAIHKFNSQFMCAVCNFSSDDVTEMLTHCRENCKSEDKSQILVMFSKCESLEAEDSSIPMWKRSVGAVRHIHGNFTEDSATLIRYYNTQPSDQLPSAATSPLRGTSNNVTLPAKPPIKPPTSSAKPRRSGGGTQLQKTGTTKTPVNPPAPPVPPAPPSPPKMEFKYGCSKCDVYKTKNPNELRIHLSNELRYKRWECLLCNTTFTTEKSLRGHIERDHQRTYSPELFVLRPENEAIEAEINNCIEKQIRKKDMINSFSVEKMGKLACKTCDEEGFTYETFETHILQKHSR